MLVPLGMRERRLLALDNGCKRGFDNVKTLVELLICDHQWNEDADYIVESSGGDGDEAVLVAILSDGFGFGVGRLARFCVAHQFDGAHSAEAANVADKRPPFLPAPGALFKMLADASGTREQAVLLDSFNGGERGGAGSGVTAVRSSERADAGGVHDFGAAGDRGDGHASAEGFRHGDQIGLDAEMFGGEPFAGAGETGLHFVSDEENAVLAANVLQQLEIVARRNDEAAFAENGFGDHGGDRIRSDRTLGGVFKVMRESFRGGGSFAAGGIR